MPAVPNQMRPTASGTHMLQARRALMAMSGMRVSGSGTGFGDLSEYALRPDAQGEDDGDVRDGVGVLGPAVADGQALHEPDADGTHDGAPQVRAAGNEHGGEALYREGVGQLR